MESRRSRWAGLVRVAAVGAAGAWGMGAMQAQQATLGRPVPWASWAALGALGALAWAARPGPPEPTERFVPRSPVSPAVLWGVSAAASLGVMLVLLDRTWVSPPPSFRTLPQGWVPLAGAWVLLAFLGRHVLGLLVRLGRRVRPRQAQWVAAGSLLASAGLTVAAAQSWRALPHSYPETLPLLGRLPPVGSLDALDPATVALPGGRYAVRRQCDGDRCTYTLDPPARPADPSDALPNEEVEVRWDPARDLLVLHTATRDLLLETRSGELHRPRDGVNLREVRAGLAPPLFWIASAAVGQLGALGMLAASGRWRRLLGALGQGREGAVRQGWVQLDGEGDLPLPASLRALPSDARVTVLAGAVGEGYRGGATDQEMLPGSIAHHRRRITRRLGDHVLLAASLALLTAAPLVAARLLAAR